jgi:Protein of unknown function (DUF4446)
MHFLTSHQVSVLIALIVIAVVQFGLLLATNSRLSRLDKLMRSLLTGPGGEDLEALLQRCLGESQQALQQCGALDERLQRVATDVRGCVQHIGVVRYDAYGDVSGSQSFSIALLDDHHNGAVITGLLGRHDGRCYGKPVVGGQTEQALSEEEESALRMALNGGVGGDMEPGSGSRPLAGSRRADKRDREKRVLHRA